jgi:hypothetical protein
VEVDRATYACVEHLAQAHIKYKIVDKKVRSAVVPLPPEARKILKKANEEPSLGDRSNMGHKFTKETNKEAANWSKWISNQGGGGSILKLIAKHGRAFLFSIDQIGYVDPEKVTPIVIFTINIGSLLAGGT